MARTAAALLAAAAATPADRIPDFNVEPHCREIAAKAAPVGDADACLADERAALNQLAGEWGQFTLSERSYCTRLSTLGSQPSYVDLLTCLEMARDAGLLRVESGAVGRGERSNRSR